MSQLDYENVTTFYLLGQFDDSHDPVNLQLTCLTQLTLE